MSEEIQKVTQNNTADFSSLNAYGVVTLENGQRVNVQMTMRHGMEADKMANDLNEYVAFLNRITEHVKIEFWDGNKGASKATETPKASGNMDWMRDVLGAPVIDKGKMILLVEGGAKTLDAKFKIECPLHSGKNLWLKEKDGGRWLSHKMDAGGYCNANIHDMITNDEPF